jgi:hypothetical protein
MFYGLLTTIKTISFPARRLEIIHSTENIFLHILCKNKLPLRPPSKPNKIIFIVVVWDLKFSQ